MQDASFDIPRKLASGSSARPVRIRRSTDSSMAAWKPRALAGSLLDAFSLSRPDGPLCVANQCSQLSDTSFIETPDKSDASQHSTPTRPSGKAQLVTEQLASRSEGNSFRL